MECGIILKVVIEDKTDKRETSDSRELEWCTVFVCAWFVVCVLYLKREKSKPAAHPIFICSRPPGRHRQSHRFYRACNQYTQTGAESTYWHIAQ